MHEKPKIVQISEKNIVTECCGQLTRLVCVKQCWHSNGRKMFDLFRRNMSLGEGLQFVKYAGMGPETLAGQENISDTFRSDWPHK